MAIPTSTALIERISAWFESRRETARTSRHQYEAGAKERIGPEHDKYLDYAHAESVREMWLREIESSLLYDLSAALAEQDATLAKAREAMIKVRAHTAWIPGAPYTLLAELLKSIERIADAATDAQEATAGKVAGHIQIDFPSGHESYAPASPRSAAQEAPRYCPECGSPLETWASQPFCRNGCSPNAVCPSCLQRDCHCGKLHAPTDSSAPPVDVAALRALSAQWRNEVQALRKQTNDRVDWIGNERAYIAAFKIEHCADDLDRLLGEQTQTPLRTGGK